MLGAIIGDIAGSRFEHHNIKVKVFTLFTENCRPTDDTVMTLAIGQAILDANRHHGTPGNAHYDDLGEHAVFRMREFGRKHPKAGYGHRFREWLAAEDPQPCNSYGNGAAMRVSACGFAAKTLDEAVSLARGVTEVTHNHPEGLKGAEAVAVAIYLARSGKSIDEIRDYIDAHYYHIAFTLGDIRENYRFDSSCRGSVPQALEAFFESRSFEDAIRNAISIGGDSDTIAAITGSIAQAYYGIPSDLAEKAMSYLYDYQREIVWNFNTAFGISTIDLSATAPKV